MLHAAGEMVGFGRSVGRDYPAIGGLRFFCRAYHDGRKKG